MLNVMKRYHILFVVATGLISLNYVIPDNSMDYLEKLKSPDSYKSYYDHNNIVSPDIYTSTAVMATPIPAPNEAYTGQTLSVTITGLSGLSATSGSSHCVEFYGHSPNFTSVGLASNSTTWSGTVTVPALADLTDYNVWVYSSGLGNCFGGGDSCIDCFTVNGAPVNPLQTVENDIYISAMDKGVIMKNAEGECYKISLDNDGSIVTLRVICPD